MWLFIGDTDLFVKAIVGILGFSFINDNFLSVDDYFDKSCVHHLHNIL